MSVPAVVPTRGLRGPILWTLGGNLVYTVPARVDLAKYRSVDIWCRRFHVSFGAAELKPA